jgi:hypothetical protein
MNQLSSKAPRVTTDDYGAAICGVAYTAAAGANALSGALHRGGGAARRLLTVLFGGAPTAADLNGRLADLSAEGNGGHGEVDRDRVGITWATCPHLSVDYSVFRFAIGIAAPHLDRIFFPYTDLSLKSRAAFEIA